MNAGSSERGRHFATKNCDLVFTILRTFDLDICTRHVQAYHKLAREEYGRDVRVWTNAYIIQGETEKEAREFHDYIVNEKGDWEAAGNVIAMMAAEVNERKYPPEQARAMTEAMIPGWGGHPLIGTKEQIVDKLADLSKMGIDGVVLSWPRYEAGMREFRDVTLPLVKQAGLRDPVGMTPRAQRVLRLVRRVAPVEHALERRPLDCALRQLPALGVGRRRHGKLRVRMRDHRRATG